MDFNTIQTIFTTWFNNHIFSNLILVLICIHCFNKHERRKISRQKLRDEENKQYQESMLEAITVLKHSLLKNWKNTNIAISLSREAHKRLDEKFKENYLNHVDSILDIKRGEVDEDIK